jgi:hypothetical protein
VKTHVFMDDLVVKSQAIDIVSVICDQSGDQTSSNCRVVYQ